MQLLREIPAHQWVVILWIGFTVVGAIWTAVTGNVGGAFGFVVFSLLMLGGTSWAYVSKRDKSDDPNTYGLSEFWKDIGDDD